MAILSAAVCKNNDLKSLKVSKVNMIKYSFLMRRWNFYMNKQERKILKAINEIFLFLCFQDVNNSRGESNPDSE